MRERTTELVNKAKEIVFSANSHDKISLWRAYVAIEHSILELKLRHGLEGQPPPPRLRRKPEIDISLARSLLGQIDPSIGDKKKLLYDLRACRDALKALVASYDRRSTTS